MNIFIKTYNKLLLPFKNSKANKTKDVDFKFSIQVDELLDTKLKENIIWNNSEVTEKPTGDLFNIWSKISGANKWHHYFPIYEKLFTEHKHKPIKILEIGVYKGASMTMWKKYFHKESIIVGLDIDANCRKFEKKEDNIYVRIGDQSDHDFLSSVISEFGDFDIIIDDGSHIVSHMIASFNYLYLKGLKKSGIYLVEDTHSNYWKTHRDQAISFIDFSKHLIDLIHFPYTLSNSVDAFRLDSQSRIKTFIVPQITVLIDEIRFYDSIVVFFKSNHKQLPVSEHL